MTKLDPRRIGKLTSSFAPMILGHSLYGNATDAYHGIVNGPTDDEGNAAMRLGHFLEGPLVQHVAKLRSIPLVHEQCFYISERNPLMASTLDGLSVGNRQSIEAKMIDDPRMLEELGEPGTDELPASVLIQVAHQQYVVPSIEVTYVPVAVWSRKTIEIYVVERDETFIAAVMEPLSEWAERHLVRKEPLEGGGMIPLAYLKKFPRQPGSSVEIDPGLVEARQCVSQIKKRVDKEFEIANLAILNALQRDGEHVEAGTIDGQTVVTYMLNNGRKGHVVKPSEPYRELRFKETGIVNTENRD